MTPRTHTVANQSPPLADHDVFVTDAALREGVARYASEGGATRLAAELSELGREAGSAATQELARQANDSPPVLRTHDRYGNRIDEVGFHPAWHGLLGRAVEWGLTGGRGEQDGLLRRAAGFHLWYQVDAGPGCPVSMTHAAVPLLRAEPSLAEVWQPLLTSRSYDPRPAAAPEKSGALAGMAMTEKQGGSDLAAGTTRARPADGAAAGMYALTGHKWFCSAPMSDVFLVLARAAEGPTCFLLPRTLPDGSRNVFRLQRLKDKLGNRANASAEVEFEETLAWRVGEEGRGIATILEMVAATRVDCVTGSAALMRRAVALAVHHTTHRAAFGGLLVDKPLMRAVLADLAVESEAATALALRLAAACDGAEAGRSHDRYLLRLAVPAAKFWVSGRCTALVAEAMECLGGNGYVEESGMPRLLREAPLNSLWEGPGNLQALDVLRALRTEPNVLHAFLTEVGQAAGADHRLDAAITAVLTELSDLENMEARARRLAERIALVLQGALLVQHAPPAVADAFCATRLGRDGGTAFGTLPAGLDPAAIVDRAAPVPAG
ncbi:acyl-CoA dehydrogenase family protein [Streptomyces lonarensis]|uniref:DNA alkylation response protein n=1 Tax=Streptomyces lonarensis TaxID=700599 RepID=A0A7X6D279_9ACTN|nr:acyl-CoA dehydrogenase family protein [Streptomyces lonarensis]NJQ06730.1 DNA alkylation response protein [Streptomyces lonarensis]